MKNNTKSPLKDRPLRMPGQSLDEEIHNILDDEVFSYLGTPILLIVFTIYNWLLWYQVIKPPNPILLSVVTIGISVYCFFRMMKVIKRLRALRLGRDGERAVGQTLEALRKKGYRIFHDLIGDGFNLDHIIVSEHGVFSVETKTYSKPIKGECKIIYDRDCLSINGQKPDKKIIIQVLAQKSWLEKQIATITGLKVSVKPVVVFPGWYIENHQNNKDELWVLEPKALPTYIENSPKIISEDNVRLISNHLSRFIRTTYDK
ncbi:MAG: nuclease-related domain-containing protein [Methylococcaceae bacterium]